MGKLAINTPLLNPAGVLGVSLGTLSGGAWLDWELQALSAAGQGEIIASPSLTVSDRQSASIEKGMMYLIKCQLVAAVPRQCSLKKLF